MLLGFPLKTRGNGQQTHPKTVCSPGKRALKIQALLIS